MFIGHYAVALAAKKAVPRVSLGTLFLAAQFLDLLWPIFLLLGLEHVRIAPGVTRFTPLDFYDYPISHSLLTTCLWALGFAIVWWKRKRSTLGAIVLACCVVSHWILDFITHRPDLPLAPGVHHSVGLSLWNSIPATIVVEVLLFAVGVVLYLSASRAKDAVGRWAFWALIAFLAASYTANCFGTPPPNVSALSWVSMTLWLFVPWGYWIDRHRTTVSRDESKKPSAMSATTNA